MRLPFYPEESLGGISGEGMQVCVAIVVTYRVMMWRENAAVSQHSFFLSFCIPSPLLMLEDMFLIVNVCSSSVKEVRLRVQGGSYGSCGSCGRYHGGMDDDDG